MFQFASLNVIIQIILFECNLSIFEQLVTSFVMFKKRSKEYLDLSQMINFYYKIVNLEGQVVVIDDVRLGLSDVAKFRTSFC